MTRDHAPAYTPAEDPYAAWRCACDHIFYPDDSLGKPCRWDLCECTDHKPREALVIEPGEISDASS